MIERAKTRVDLLKLKDNLCEMKNLFTLLSIAFFLCNIYGQTDTVFTLKGDTIAPVKITKVTATTVWYTQKNIGKSIPASDVKRHTLANNIDTDEDETDTQCNKTEVSVDKFKNETTYTNRVGFADGINNKVNLTFVKQGQSYFVKMSFSMTGLNSLVIGHDDSLQIKFTSGEIIKFKPTEIVSGEFMGTGSYRYTMITEYYNCTKEDLKAISSSPISMMRIEFTSGTYHNIEIKPKISTKLKAAAKCISEK